VLAADHQESGNRADHGAACRIAGRAGGRLHAVVFQDAQVGPEDADLLQGRTDGEGQDTGRDGHTQTPSGFQAHIEVGQTHHHAQDCPEQYGPHGELWDIAVVIILEPLQFNLLGAFPRRVNPEKLFSSLLRHCFGLWSQNKANNDRRISWPEPVPSIRRR
jgi:hypothetical protein